VKEAPKKQGYYLDPEVEQVAVLACCQEPKFYAVVGHAIEPERLRHPVAKLIIQGVHVLSGKHKQSPTWIRTVVQYFETQMSRGKTTLDDLNAVKDYLLDADMLPKVAVDELAKSVVPVVQRVMHREAIVATGQGFTNNQSAAEAAEIFEKVGRLGVMPVVQSMSIHEAVLDDAIFKPDEQDDLLRLGVQEVDDALGGGLERQSLLLLVGGSGSGKSMGLAHAAVESFIKGRHVFYVTLELSIKRTFQRMLRNITDMTRREMELDPKLARARFAKYEGLSGGMLRVFYAEPIVTTPKDIRRLIEHAMKADKDYRPSLFVVDFLDKLRTSQKASLYEDMLVTADTLRQIGVDHDGWMLTASQGTRKAESNAWPELDAIADSMNKVRSADAVIAIGRTREDKEAEQIRFNIPKRREGEGAHTRVGPIAWDPEHGRIAVVSDRVFPW